MQVAEAAAEVERQSAASRAVLEQPALAADTRVELPGPEEAATARLVATDVQVV